jgi:hypothetical protein
MQTNLRAKITNEPNVYILEYYTILGLWSEVLDVAGNPVYLDYADITHHNIRRCV